MKNKATSIIAISILILGFTLNVIPIGTVFGEDDHGDNRGSSSHDQKSFDNSTSDASKNDHQFGDNVQFNQEQNRTRSNHQGENKTMFDHQEENRMMTEQQRENKTMSEKQGENETQRQNEDHQGQNETEREQSHYGIINPTEQDMKNIDQAKTNQTIAAEVNVGTNNTQTSSIDNNVSVQTTQNTPDSLGVQVSATNQTGPKVIVFNIAATSINVQNLKNLGIMYDGQLIQPAPNMDAILHAKSTDNPSFAIVVTQSGVQVLVLVPHFSTHTITITNMSQVIQVVPEFGPVAGVIITIAVIGSLVISRRFS